MRWPWQRQQQPQLSHEQQSSLVDHHCPYRATLEDLIVWADRASRSGSGLVQAAQILAKLGFESPVHPDADPLTGCLPVTPASPRRGG